MTELTHHQRRRDRIWKAIAYGGAVGGCWLLVSAIAGGGWVWVPIFAVQTAFLLLFGWAGLYGEYGVYEVFGE